MVIIGLRFDENLIRDGSCCFLDRTFPNVEHRQVAKTQTRQEFQTCRFE